MREVLIEVFGNFSKWIVLIHVVSAMALLGSLVIMRIVVEPMLRAYNDEKTKLVQGIKGLSRFGKFIVPVMLILIGTSVLMSVGLGFKYGNPTTYVLIHIKEALWTFIAFNFIYAYWKYRGAKIALKSGEFIETRENLILVYNYLIPLNAFLCIVAAYFGITIRGY